MIAIRSRTQQLGNGILVIAIAVVVQDNCWVAVQELLNLSCHNKGLGFGVPLDGYVVSDRVSMLFCSDGIRNLPNQDPM